MYHILDYVLQILSFGWLAESQDSDVLHRIGQYYI